MEHQPIELRVSVADDVSRSIRGGGSQQHEISVMQTGLMLVPWMTA